mmetsp:Transcript_32125/g.75536  ORF Transcript_32125/g.75536 Transcript_32125/m.75536 type:complete len:679 (-) Transcript_32125:2597-4633(-)
MEEIMVESSESRRRSFMSPPRRKGQRGLGRSLDGMGTSSTHTVSSLNGSVHSTTSTSNNPITNDLQLNILVHSKLDKITKYKPFQRWKSKFLGRFETYLTESGREPAREASENLQRHLEGCVKRADFLLDHIEKGDLSPTTGRKTVRASLALNEFCLNLNETRVELRELVPAKQVDERRLQYTKFHVGASLIDEGFPQYVAMRELEEKVQEIADLTRDTENDEDILDKQQRELFHNYKKQVTRFCDVMADLDLYEIMLKCVQFLHPPDHEESDDEELTIFVKRYEGGTKNGRGISLFRPKKNIGSDNMPDDFPQKKTIKVDVDDNETIATVATLASEELGFQLKPAEVIDISNQLTIRYSNDTKVVDTPQISTLRQLGIENGDVLTIEKTMLSIQVRIKNANGEPFEMEVKVDPDTSLKDLRALLEEEQNQHEDLESILADDQVLSLDGVELTDNDRSCTELGIVSGSVLDLEAKPVPVEEDNTNSEEEKIVIVDTKYGTMFSVDRETAIEKGVLTPKVVNDVDQFIEATNDDFDKIRMRKSMLSSPNLKVKPQIVVPKLKIEAYELEEAEKVQNLWGVNLKKTSHKKRGTEILFVDLKTQAVGFLNRTKLMNMEFITVVKVVDPSVLGDNKKGEVEETLEQAETDQQKYDFFVTRIRRIFGIAYEESLKSSENEEEE